MKPKFTYEDVVLRLKKTGDVSVGLVVETIDDRPDLSSDEDVDEDLPKLKEGQCRVAWFPKGRELLEPEQELVLGDKSLMPGDIVELRHAPGRKGFCLNVRVKACVRPLLPYRHAQSTFLVDIDTSKFAPLLDFAEGYVVNLGAWVGMVRYVAPRVYASVTCSWDHQKAERRCTLSEKTALDFHFVDRVDDDDYEFESCSFYPGQRLQGPYKFLQNDVTWLTQPPPVPPVVAKKKLKKSFKKRDVHLAVYDVRTDYVTVSWSHTIAGPGAKMPPTKIEGDELKKLKMLHVYEPAAVQIGRLRRYIIRPEDKLLSDAEFQAVARDKYAKAGGLVNGDGNNNKSLMGNKKGKRPKKPTVRVPRRVSADKKSDSDDDDDSEPATDRSSGWTSEVTSEDKSQESRGGASGEKQVNSGAEKSTSRDVVDQARDGTGSAHEGASTTTSVLQPGDVVVVQVVFTETEVDVKWQDEEVSCGIRSNMLLPVEHLDEHEFFPGDYVIPQNYSLPHGFGVVQKVDHDERTAKVAWYRVAPNETNPAPTSAPDASAAPGDGADNVPASEAEKETEGAEDVHKTGDIPKPVTRNFDKNSTVEVEAEEELSVYDLQGDNDLDFGLGTVVMLKTDANPDVVESEAAATVGQVINVERNGMLKVRWGDGRVSSHWPIAIRRLGDYDSDDGELWERRGDSSCSSCDSSDSGGDSSSDSDAGESVKDGEDVPSDDGDDEWVTASNDSTSSAVSEYGDDDGGDDSDYSEDPDEPGSVLVSLKTLPKSVMALDYTGKAEEVPSYKIIRKKFVQKVTLLERVRDRIWSELAKHEADGEKARYLTCTPENLPEMCVDCCLLDKLMDSKVFRQRTVDWAAFPCLKSTIGPVFLDRAARCFPDFVRVMTQTVLVNGLGVPAAEDRVFFLNPGNVRKSEKEEVVTFFQDYVTFNSFGDALTTDQLKDAVAAFSRGSAAEKSDGSSSDEWKEKMAKLRLSGNASGIIPIPIAPTVLRVFYAWLRDRLFNASVAIVTDFGSNAVMDMDVFYPPRDDDDDDDDDDDGADEDFEAMKAAMMIESGGASAVASTESQLATPVKSKDAIAVSSKESYIASPEPIVERGSFEVIDAAPFSHRYVTIPAPSPGSEFNRAVMREIKLLRTSLPKGVHVRAFEDRRDLFSAMVEGPAGTPYEGGLFFFDCQLPSGYPVSPPHVQYISYVSDKLNPNLYEEGKVCLSLLGTWDGRGSELWTRESNLLQLLVSIQGLILNKEPYYNEAGYERQRGERLAAENSRKYNEMAVVKVVQAMAQLTSRELPAVFAEDIVAFLQKHGWKTVERFKTWMSQANAGDSGQPSQPDYPLMPLSRGFILCMEKALKEYEKGLDALGIRQGSVTGGGN